MMAVMDFLKRYINRVVGTGQSSLTTVVSPQLGDAGAARALLFILNVKPFLLICLRFHLQLFSLSCYILPQRA